MGIPDLIILLPIGLIAGGSAGIVMRARLAESMAISSRLSEARLWMDYFWADWGLAVSGMLTHGFTASAGAIVMVCLWRTLARGATKVRIFRKVCGARSTYAGDPIGRFFYGGWNEPGGAAIQCAPWTHDHVYRHDAAGPAAGHPTVGRVPGTIV